MKIGIFSDIHSDLPALEKTLAYLHSQALDQIICLGDVVETGVGNGDAVVARLQAENIPCVMGNHDSYTVQHHQWTLNHWGSDDLPDRLLKPETIEYLKNLPMELRYEWDGRRVLVSHGTWISVFPNSPARFFKRIAEQSDADILLLGHTHEPMQVHCQQVQFYNPGAVCTRQGGTLCAILTLPDLTFEVRDIDKAESLDLPYLDIDSELEDGLSFTESA